MKYSRRSPAAAFSVLFRKRSLLLPVVAMTASLPLSAVAAEIETATTISRLYSYSDGSAIVEVVNPPTQQLCTAFWIRTSDVGAKNSFALALSAYHTQVIVRVVAENSELWSGSSTPHCRVKAIALD